MARVGPQVLVVPKEQLALRAVQVQVDHLDLLAQQALELLEQLELPVLQVQVDPQDRQVLE